MTPTVLLPVCGLQAFAHGSVHRIAKVLHLKGTWVWMGEFAFLLIPALMTNLRHSLKPSNWLLLLLHIISSRKRAEQQLLCSLFRANVCLVCVYLCACVFLRGLIAGPSDPPPWHWDWMEFFPSVTLRRFGSVTIASLGFWCQRSLKVSPPTFISIRYKDYKVLIGSLVPLFSEFLNLQVYFLHLGFYSRWSGGSLCRKFLFFFGPP